MAVTGKVFEAETGRHYTTQMLEVFRIEVDSDCNHRRGPASSN